ncbi:hypothetical protein ACFWYA_13025 [Streptomyces sp. NPDC059011]
MNVVSYGGGVQSTALPEAIAEAAPLPLVDSDDTECDSGWRMT